MVNEEAQARVDVWKYAFGFDTMRVVKCAIDLGLPDVLESHGSPITLSELSTILNCSPSSLYRIMRFLTNLGIFKLHKTSSSTGQMGENHESLLYAQTPLSRLLTKDNMAPFVLLQSNPPAPWSGINANVLRAGGRSAYGNTKGEDIWSGDVDLLEIEKHFDDSMACHARLATSALISNYSEALQGIGSLVDVGGRHGLALGMLWILHDWSDELCIDILKKCKEAVPVDTGKVIIVEAVIDEEGGDEYTSARLALDITMMAGTVKGKERTSKEWVQLLNDAGYRSHKITHIKAIESVIEAYP
ncbi:hypothetical protein ACJIZ3_009113 [Penstemon smallii]|uniref:Uncharacterized protein n=1 Tax=Penstemon smallii TaxID=265156 RepID=A0ABD3TBL6_9LAMI